MEEINNSTTSAEEISQFDGGMFANFFIGAATLLVSLITLGLAYPAMVCMKLRWEAKHTYLNGRQLTFDGNAAQLMGKYILWLFLSVITFGLYFIFSAKLKLTEWQTKHTHFAGYQYDEEGNQSKFSGKWYQLIGVNYICNFVTVITLFIGYYWAHCYKERWYCKHKTIDGCRLEFDGTGMQYFGKRIIWTLLTLVTFGIYSFWLQIKSVKWTVSHTKLLDKPNMSESVEFAKEISQKKKAEPKPINKMAIAGLILSILTYTYPIGFILSIIGLRKSKNLKGSGKIISIVGIIISSIMFLASIILIMSKVLGR